MTAQVIDLDAYEAIGDGETPCDAAFSNAVAAAGHNGTVLLGGGKKYRLTQTFQFPKGVRVVGAGPTGGDRGYGWPWQTELAGLVLDPNVSLLMESRVHLEGFAILPTGKVFPDYNPASWVGTAIAGAIPNGTLGYHNILDLKFRDLLIVGFNRAMDLYSVPRVVTENVMFDCQYGIRIDSAGDPIRMNNCHAWPFGTVDIPNVYKQMRAGPAYEFVNNTDAAKVSNCFAHRYSVGYKCVNVNGIEFINCGCEAPDYTEAMGFVIEGSTPSIGMTSCQAVAVRNGVVINTTSPKHVVLINGGLFIANRDDNFRAFNGILHVRGARLGTPGASNGSLAGAGGRIIMSDCLRLEGNNKAWVANYSGTGNYQLVNNFDA